MAILIEPNCLTAILHQYTVDNGTMYITKQLISSNDGYITTVPFDERSIISAINKLKSNLSSGPDQLPPLLYKHLKHNLAQPLALLFMHTVTVCWI